MGRDLIHGENSAIHPVKSRRGKKCWATVGSVGRSPGNDKTDRGTRARLDEYRSISLLAPFFLSLFLLFFPLPVNDCTSLPVFINRHDSREPSLEIWFFTLLLILVKGSHTMKDRVLFPWWINWIDSFRKRVLVPSLCIHFFVFLRSILDTQLHAARKTVQISDFLWLVPRWNSVLLPCVFSIRTNSPFFYFFPALKNETANAFLSANDRTTREKKGKRDQKCETFRSDR